jgi:hypothetical protein
MKSFTVLLFLAVVSACPALAKVSFLRVPDGGLQPQATVDPAGVLHLVYMNGKPAASDIWYVRREPGAKDFSKALRVNRVTGSAMVAGNIRGARVALGGQGSLHVVWNGSGQARPVGPKGETPFLYSRLDPSTGKFQPERNLVVSAYGLDGGGAIGADQTGRVVVAWVGGQEETHRKVWMRVSEDEGRTFGPERLAADGFGACGCCGMAAATLGPDQDFILYRTAKEGRLRGMHLVRSSGKGFTEEALDQWELEACPMSQASFEFEKTGQPSPPLLGAWEKDGQVYVRSMNQVGPLWIPEVKGRAKYPSVAVSGERALVVWAEGTGWAKGGKVAWQEFGLDGRPLGRTPRREGLPAWSLPAVVAYPAGDFTIIY